MAVIITCYSGFLQNEARYTSNGMQMLVENLRCLQCDFWPHVRTYYRPWNYNVRAMARLACSIVDGGDYEIVTIGYSYGANACLWYCRELQRLGMEVSQVVLVDPVKRSRWLPKPLPSPSSMFRSRNLPLCGPWPRFNFSSNVRRLTHWNQRVDLPQGHSVLQNNDERKGKTVVDGTGHTKMDNHLFVQADCIGLVENAVERYMERRNGQDARVS